MSRLTKFALATLMSLLLAAPALAQPGPKRKLLGSPAQFAQNPEVLIVYEPGKADEARASAEQAGFNVIEDYAPGHYLRCKPKPTIAAVAVSANQVAANETIRFVEPNYRVSIPEPAGPPRPAPAGLVHTDVTPAAAGVQPNDPMFNKLWGMVNIKAPEAWADHTSTDIVIGVIDSGVDYTHEDLVANMWTNPGEIPDDGMDNDGNGIADDIFGARFSGGAGSGDPMDDNSHGTHCAGTIGAIGNNSLGVAGVNWKVKIMALKFLEAGGSGFTDDAIRCIDYAVKQKQNGVNIRVLSNSWGGGGFSTALEEAIGRAEDAGILFVAAAGNETNDNDANPSFPASYDNDNVISVASINRREEISWFSNFGKESVDLAAPGGTLEGDREDDILSTIPKNLDTSDGTQDGYSAFAGTSMATPHVSGAIALAWGSPALSTKLPDEIKQLILDKARPLGSLTGKCATGATLDISFLADGGTVPPPIGPFIYTGVNGDLAGSFAINGTTGSAMYHLSDLAFQSKLNLLEEATSPDGHDGWVYREDYPDFPFDFLLTKSTIGDVSYYRVYYRPAIDDPPPFSWFCNAVRSDELTINATGIGQSRKEAYDELGQ